MGEIGETELESQKFLTSKGYLKEGGEEEGRGGGMKRQNWGLTILSKF